MWNSRHDSRRNKTNLREDQAKIQKIAAEQGWNFSASFDSFYNRIHTGRSHIVHVWRWTDSSGDPWLSIDLKPTNIAVGIIDPTIQILLSYDEDVKMPRGQDLEEFIKEHMIHRFSVEIAP